MNHQTTKRSNKRIEALEKIADAIANHRKTFGKTHQGFMKTDGADSPGLMLQYQAGVVNLEMAQSVIEAIIENEGMINGRWPKPEKGAK